MDVIAHVCLSMCRETVGRQARASAVVFSMCLATSDSKQDRVIAAPRVGEQLLCPGVARASSQVRGRRRRPQEAIPAEDRWAGSWYGWTLAAHLATPREVSRAVRLSAA